MFSVLFWRNVNFMTCLEFISIQKIFVVSYPNFWDRSATNNTYISLRSSFPSISPYSTTLVGMWSAFQGTVGDSLT